jgi:hypothetical protein
MHVHTAFNLDSGLAPGLGSLTVTAPRFTSDAEPSEEKLPQNPNFHRREEKCRGNLILVEIVEVEKRKNALQSSAEKSVADALAFFCAPS